MSTEMIETGELMERVQTILDKVDLPDRHSFFQIEKFIIAKEPTAQGQLWQIVREMQSRIETIDSYQKQLENAEDDLELFDIKIERLGEEIRLIAQETIADPVKGSIRQLNIREHEVNIRKLQREKGVLVDSAQAAAKKLKSVLEELSFLLMGFEKITKEHGPVIQWDDTKAQKEYWNEKLLEEFNLRLLLNRPLDPEFVKTTMCLGEDTSVQQQMTKLLQQIQDQPKIAGK